MYGERWVPGCSLTTAGGATTGAAGATIGLKVPSTWTVPVFPANLIAVVYPTRATSVKNFMLNLY